MSNYLDKSGLGKYTTQLVEKLKTILALKNEIIKKISGLDDVAISEVANKQTLVYNSTTKKWENATPSSSLGALDDVTLANVSADQTLVYDAQTGKWKNADPKGTIADLTDTNIASLTNSQILVYDSTSGKWLNKDQRTPLTAAQIQAIINGVNVYTVSFYNGSKLLSISATLQNGNVEYLGEIPVDPDGKKFLGWANEDGQHAADSDALQNITADKSVYAAFTSVAVPTSHSAENAYGVKWNYANSSPALTRLGLASSFADPAPATSLNGSGSSPFDNIAPWKDMKRYNIIDGAVSYSQDDSGFSETDYDTVVYIPEFYYTAQKDEENSKWLWAISPTKLDGYVKHPGSGRYVGRFHTSGNSSAVYSKSGVAPLGGTSLDNFRTYHHNKGANWYTLDIATWSALQMLYLVESANFHSQSVLGTGHDTGLVGNTGGTTGASYHTLKRDNADNMYRWVENPFSQVYDWIDGILTSAKAVYTGVDNDRFTDDVGSLSETNITLPSSGFITGFGYSEECQYAFIPDAASGGQYTTYVTDKVNSSTAKNGVYVGGDRYTNCGFFFFGSNYHPSGTSASLGSRLLYIPESN